MTLLVTFIAICLFWSYLKPLWRTSATWFMKNTMATKLKIIFAFVQIAVSLDSTYLVSLPNDVHTLLAYLKWIATLGFDDMGLPLQCLGLHSFMARLVTALVLPLLIIAITVLSVALTHGIRRGKQGAESVRRAARHGRWVDGPRDDHKKARSIFLNSLDAALRILFLAYPIVLGVAFRAFVCEEFDVVGAWLVRLPTMQTSPGNFYT